MKIVIRINKKNGSIKTAISCQKEWDELVVLIQKNNWTYDIVGRRPW